MTLVYRTGDLFTRDCPALGQGVNTLGRMGAGLGGLAWDDVAAALEVELAPVPYVEVWAVPPTWIAAAS